MLRQLVVLESSKRSLPARHLVSERYASFPVQEVWWLNLIDWFWHTGDNCCKPNNDRSPAPDCGNWDEGSRKSLATRPVQGLTLATQNVAVDLLHHREVLLPLLNREAGGKEPKTWKQGMGLTRTRILRGPTRPSLPRVVEVVVVNKAPSVTSRVGRRSRPESPNHDILPGMI